MKNSDLRTVTPIPQTTNPTTRWDRNPTCWRYVDLLSLLSIISNEAIHFTHLTDLYKYDPEEGTGGLQIELVNDPIVPSVLVSPSNPRVTKQNEKEIRKIKAKLARPVADQLPKFRKKLGIWDKENDTIYISSWHVREIDSDFMWRIYGRYEYGFAIESSVQDLVHSFIDAGISSNKLGHGAVIYPTRDVLIRDELHEKLGSSAAFMIKSPQYFQEKEYRIFVRARKRAASCDISVNLKKLVHRIHISPLVPRWAVQPIMDTLNPICSAKGIPHLENTQNLLRAT